MLKRALIVCLLLGVLPGMSRLRAEEEGFSWGDLLPTSLQKNPRINITVNTELTEEGRKFSPPSRSSPAYYTIVDGGRVEEGDAVRGEQWPAANELGRLIGLALAKGGYQPAGPAHPPTVTIHYRWGVFNRRGSFEGSAPDDGTVLPPDPFDPVEVRNVAARAVFVGGEKFAQEMLLAFRRRRIDSFRMQSWQNDNLVSLVFHDLYVILASGYDYAAMQRGEKKLLWKTRIAAPSRGLTLPETLTSLAINAGAYIGHETAPVIIHRRLAPGHVTLAEPVFEEYKSESPRR